MPSEDETSFRLEIPTSSNGERLDRFLAVRVPSRSRTQLQRHILLGAVTVEGELPSRGAKTKVRTGQEVIYVPPPPEALTVVPQALPLTILYEDTDLVVVNKAAGMVVHPAPGHPDGTLVNALLHHFSLDASEEIRPGIVHRLDRGTTGVMVVAKNERAHEALSSMFSGREVYKRYLALCRGVPRPATQTLETLYGRDPLHRKKFSSRVEKGKTAKTEYRVLSASDDAAWLELILHTGRTHQIRVHLADLGHGLVGDPLYGRTPKSARLRELSETLGRPALHAAELGLAHPRTRAPLRFSAPIPSDLKNALQSLDLE